MGQNTLMSMLLSENLFYTDPATAFILIGASIIVFLLRGKIGNRLAAAIIIFLIGIVFFGLAGLIRMTIGAISGALFFDEIRKRAEKEFYEEETTRQE